MTDEVEAVARAIEDAVRDVGGRAIGNTFFIARAAIAVLDKVRAEAKQKKLEAARILPDIPDGCAPPPASDGLVERLRGEQSAKIIRTLNEGIKAGNARIAALQAELRLAKLEADGVESLLLDVQRDCITAVQERDALAARIAVLEAENARLRDALEYYASPNSIASAALGEPK